MAYNRHYTLSDNLSKEIMLHGLGARQKTTEQRLSPARQRFEVVFAGLPG